MSQQTRSVVGAVVDWVLQTRGWTQARFAETVNVSPGWVSHVLKGRRSPEFEMIVDVLAQAGYCLVLVESDCSGDGRGVRRRRFLIDIGTVGLAPVGAAIPLGSGTPDLGDAAAVTALTRRYVALEREIGGAVIFVPAARLARRLMHELEASDGVDAAYQRAVGGFLHQLAWLAYDSGRRPATDSYGSDALRLAEHTGDRLLQARACNVLSLAKAAAKDRLGAAEIARRGVAAARDDEAISERTLLWARLARVEAARGPDRESYAMRALRRAQEAVVDDRSAYEVVANRGIVLAELGRFAEARTALAKAAEMIGCMGEPRNRCIYLARSAKVAVRQDELEEAADLIAQFLDEARDITSARVDSHLREWMKLTEPSRIATARSIRGARDRARDHLIPSTRA